MTQSAISQQSHVTAGIPAWPLWGRWVLANALAEMLGLGTSALLWIGIGPRVEEVAGVVAAALLTVLGSTLLEGTAVGVGQWLVLRRPLPALALRTWFLATAAGAFVAWSLGMIPSTMMSMAADTGQAAAGPPVSDAVMLGLAALMGLVLGPVLAFAQWLVLRSHVAQAAWWIPANALAWAAGMVIIFQVVGMAPYAGPLWALALTVLAGLAVAGAAVGAIHGAVLVRLLKPFR